MMMDAAKMIVNAFMTKPFDLSQTRRTTLLADGMR